MFKYLNVEWKKVLLVLIFLLLGFLVFKFIFLKKDIKSIPETVHVMDRYDMKDPLTGDVVLHIFYDEFNMANTSISFTEEKVLWEVSLASNLENSTVEKISSEFRQLYPFKRINDSEYVCNAADHNAIFYISVSPKGVITVSHKAVSFISFPPHKPENWIGKIVEASNFRDLSIRKFDLTPKR